GGSGAAGGMSVGVLVIDSSGITITGNNTSGLGSAGSGGSGGYNGSSFALSGESGIRTAVYTY
ncbi:MAG: hypothetical protein KC561_10370, partial [Myxococcales bacterium]|nr:hypothetical protein [Myxococcales bacterium]